ncbi:MAG: FAD-binding protein [Deltaproteobacteria bacterium]|nr:FAD-binding protein [Deltaproteobacteria bacterium]
MDYQKFTEEDFEFLRDLVGKERASKGESNLNIHSHDESFHAGYFPDVVVWPLATEEVSKILAYANERRIPVTPWGVGTSLEGNPLPMFGGIVLDFERMDKIIAIRAEDFQVDVQAGVKYQDLNKALRWNGLFFAPDPGANATIGGMIGNNASGVRTVKYGGTRDNVAKLTVVLADGRVIHPGNFAQKSSSGYDLVHLIIGSEGTLGIVTEATLRLVGIPEKFSAAVATFPTVKAATQAVYDIMVAGLGPAALELLDVSTVKVINEEAQSDLKEAPTLFMEFTGTSDMALAEDVNFAETICADDECTSFESGVGPDERNQLWEKRHMAYEYIKRNNPGMDFMILDTAVPLSKYPEMVDFAVKTVEKFSIKGYAFGHAGDGNLHLVIAGDFSDADFCKKRDEANYEIVSHAISLGGTATGEHGVGIGKKKFMPLEHGESLEVMKEIKKMMDPNGILNPGKMVDMK